MFRFTISLNKFIKKYVYILKLIFTNNSHGPTPLKYIFPFFLQLKYISKGSKTTEPFDLHVVCFEYIV